MLTSFYFFFFFFQAEDGIRDYKVTGVQTCALPISRQVHARPAQHEPVVLDVVPRLRHRGVREQRAQRSQRVAGEGGEVPGRDAARELAVGRDVREREVPGAPGRAGERHADERRAHRIERRRFGVERHERRPAALRHDRGERGGVVHDRRFGAHGGERGRGGGRPGGGRRGGGGPPGGPGRGGAPLEPHAPF